MMRIFNETESCLIVQSAYGRIDSLNSVDGSIKKREEKLCQGEERKNVQFFPSLLLYHARSIGNEIDRKPPLV